VNVLSMSLVYVTHNNLAPTGCLFLISGLKFTCTFTKVGLSQQLLSSGFFLRSETLTCHFDLRTRSTIFLSSVFCSNILDKTVVTLFLTIAKLRCFGLCAFSGTLYRWCQGDQHAKYLDRKFFCSKVIVAEHTHTHTHQTDCYTWTIKGMFTSLISPYLTECAVTGHSNGELGRFTAHDPVCRDQSQRSLFIRNEVS